MRNRIILTTNQKGGVGKTQICATAATLFVQTLGVYVSQHQRHSSGRENGSAHKETTMCRND